MGVQHTFDCTKHEWWCLFWCEDRSSDGNTLAWHLRQWRVCCHVLRLFPNLKYNRTVGRLQLQIEVESKRNHLPWAYRPQRGSVALEKSAQATGAFFFESQIPKWMPMSAVGVQASSVPPHAISSQLKKGSNVHLETKPSMHTYLSTGVSAKEVLRRNGSQKESSIS